MIDVGAKLANAQRLMAQGKAAQAQADLRRALQQAPGSPELNNAMALVLGSMGQAEQAVYFAQKALSGRPEDPILLLNAGTALGRMSRTAEAYPLLLKATERAPDMPEARLGLANVLRLRHEHTGAARQAREGLRIRPRDPHLAANYASSLTNMARGAEAVDFLKAWLAAGTELGVASVYANAMTYHAGATPAESFAAQMMYGRMVEASVRPMPAATVDRAPDRVLRVGVMSAELRRHAVATFLEPWLAHHDRKALRITCYPTLGQEDHVSARLKKHAAEWVPAGHLPDAELAARIRADKIDILIETTGITQGHRLGVMAMRPAPLQASFIGYLNTTGLKSIDYRIVDGHTDPPGAEEFSAEKLVRLDPTYWCYHPPTDAPEPARPTGEGIVFGSFNAAVKINEAVISLWAAVLRAVPGSRLLLKAFDFSDAELRADVASRFEREGIEPGRVSCEGPTQELGAFLANYNRVDVGLDPFPFNGTTTTMDALWMGVPVVTLEGRMHAGRTGVSIYRTLGMPELIAPDRDAYVRIAAGLAQDADRRAELRRTLRQRAAASALCDGPGFAGRVDAALRRMWHERGGAAG